KSFGQPLEFGGPVASLQPSPDRDGLPQDHTSHLGARTAIAPPPRRERHYPPRAAGGLGPIRPARRGTGRGTHWAQPAGHAGMTVASSRPRRTRTRARSDPARPPTPPGAGGLPRPATARRTAPGSGPPRRGRPAR